MPDQGTPAIANATPPVCQLAPAQSVTERGTDAWHTLSLMTPEDTPGRASDGAAGTPDDTGTTSTEDGVFLSWAGRKGFRAAVPTPRVFVPVPEASDPTEEDPGNLVIEGDNRQAMVSLFPQYQSQVDVVAIDVPYNTGKNDFRYHELASRTLTPTRREAILSRPRMAASTLSG